MIKLFLFIKHKNHKIISFENEQIDITELIKAKNNLEKVINILKMNFE